MVEFLSMGGHGGYIWAGYGVSALILTALIINRYGELREHKKRSMIIDGEA